MMMMTTENDVLFEVIPTPHSALLITIIIMTMMLIEKKNVNVILIVLIERARALALMLKHGYAVGLATQQKGVAAVVVRSVARWYGYVAHG